MFLPSQGKTYLSCGRNWCCIKNLYSQWSVVAQPRCTDPCQVLAMEVSHGASIWMPTCKNFEKRIFWWGKKGKCSDESELLLWQNAKTAAKFWNPCFEGLWQQIFAFRRAAKFIFKKYVNLRARFPVRRDIYALCAYTHIYIYLYLHICIRVMYIYTYIHNMHTYVLCVYTYICMYKYIYIYLQIYTYDFDLQKVSRYIMVRGIIFKWPYDNNYFQPDWFLHKGFHIF